MKVSTTFNNFVVKKNIFGLKKVYSGNIICYFFHEPIICTIYILIMNNDVVIIEILNNLKLLVACFLIVELKFLWN